MIWLVDRDQMGSHPGPGHLGGQLDYMNSPGGTEVLTAPAVWINPAGQPITIYANDSGVTAYKVVTSGSKPKLGVVWQFSSSATTPIVSGNVVYMATDGEVAAFDPATGHQLWASTNTGAGGTIGGVHWEYPTVFGNDLFITDESGKLYEYRRSG